jgi:hypothetical protein
MKSIGKVVLVSAALAAAGAGSASASTTFDWKGCGGSSFNTCASVSIAVVAGELVMTVQNWATTDPNTNTTDPSAFGIIFTAIGLSNAGVTLTGLDSAVCTNDPSCAWVFASTVSELSNLGGFAVYAGADRASQGGVNNGLNPPGSPGPGVFTQVVLTFTYTGTLNFDGAAFGLHGQGGPLDCDGSTKLSVIKSAEGGVYTPNVNTTCAPPPPDILVPEPVTLSLLATGLIGLVGAGSFRRRNQKG